jgi:hypothetical protein
VKMLMKGFTERKDAGPKMYILYEKVEKKK